MQSKLKMWNDADGSIHLTLDMMACDLIAANIQEGLHEQVRLLGYSESPADWLRAAALLWEGMKRKPELDVPPGLVGPDAP